MIGLNRRRMMGNVITPIERLRQLGCLMWFPLGSTLTDAMGNRSISKVNENSFVYDSTYPSYEFRFTQQRIGYIDISDLTSADFVDGVFTTIVQARRYKQAGYRGTSACFKVNNVAIGGAFNSTGTAATNNWTDDLWHEGVIVRHQDGTREVYGDQVMVINNPATYPDIWNYSTIDIQAGNYQRLPIKNFLLFNRALTASEIAEVHQIIG